MANLDLGDIVAFLALVYAMWVNYSSGISSEKAIQQSTIQSEKALEQLKMQSESKLQQLNTESEKRFHQLENARQESKIQSEKAIQQAKIQSEKALEQSETAIKQSNNAIRDARLHALFSGFDQANGELMRKPMLLNHVHGLVKDKDELENIAYLGILIDAFHHYWGKEYKDNYEEAIKKEPSNFIHKIVAVEANYERWQDLKEINYGDDDKAFLKEMDKLFDNAKAKNEKKKA